MDRRTFLGTFIAAIIALFFSFQPQAKVRAKEQEIKYWIVVGGQNPFVFGVKNDSEVRAFKRAQPAHYASPEAARAATATA